MSVRANDNRSTSAPTERRPGRRIAVIGGGIAGLGAAWLLQQRHEVTLYEREPRLGGHSHTVEAPGGDGRTVPVDTGFIVYNERNYPNLCALFAHLKVPTRPSDMSFSVSVEDGRLEWAGDNLLKLFGQPRNLLRPAFHRMLRDILRFNRDARLALQHGNLEGMSLGRFLAAQGYAPELARDYLLPMGAAIWSAPTAAMAAFPAENFLRFFDNHGLLDMSDRPRWRTVAGGSRSYVDRLAADLGPAVLRTGCAAQRVSRDRNGAVVTDRAGDRARYDEVVFACHADEALALLADPDPEEAYSLSAIRFQENEAVLHSDPTLMPRRRRLWSSWNYLSAGAQDGRVSVSYWMNRLQGIDRRFPLFVTLNPQRPPAAEAQIGRFVYHHPVFDRRACEAQARLGRLQGQRRTWYCGAWLGYGFHEDGLASAIAVARSFGAAPPWPTAVPPAGGRDGSGLRNDDGMAPPREAAASDRLVRMA
ncbi:NAD(P)/FAD-dependent oxidoreductase [Marinibaculum pumilum]|uniref:NAD(P)/FAD-dependent oxidoreductase n=1 Tax=Marinibaculum pumilum TaxID=1766165 RepID=A0ABV7KX04_9PROT